MGSHEDDFDFEALAREIDIDQQVRLGAAMLEIREGLKLYDKQLKSCNQAFDELEALIDKIEKNRDK